MAGLVSAVAGWLTLRRIKRLDRLGISEERQRLDDLTDDVIARLGQKIALLDQEIIFLTAERDRLRARVAELEAEKTRLNEYIAKHAIGRAPGD